MPATGPVQPRQARSQATLKRILEGALAALSTRDLAEVSVEEIAKAAGVSVGALYTRFRGKDELLAYVIEALQTAQVEQLRTVLDESAWRGQGLEARIDWLVQQLTATARERPALVRAIFASLMAPNTPGGSATAERNGEVVEVIADWLLRSGEVRAPDPKLAARVTTAWLSYSLHLAHLYAFAFPGAPPESSVPELRRSALRALGAA